MLCVVRFGQPITIQDVDCSAFETIALVLLEDGKVEEARISWRSLYSIWWLHVFTTLFDKIENAQYSK